jgi:ribosomal protein S18 acetylase RimI-like enzyme
MTSRFVGYVETVEPALAGWVIDRERPDEPVRFTVTVDRYLRFEIVADLPRPDVTAAGLGGPNCGFELALPPLLFDGKAHDIDLALGDRHPLVLPAWRSPVALGPISPAIVRLTAAGLGEIAELLRLTHLESGLEPNAITDRYVADWIARNALLLGAHVGPRLVGYASLDVTGTPGAGVLAMSILRFYRRKGLGEKLLRALLAAVRSGGAIDAVWLAVAPKNLPARRLYEKLGFVDRAPPPPSLVAPANYLTMLWRADGSAR